jgi:glycosyltransferase involved in cell wall biosynthesis
LTSLHNLRKIYYDPKIFYLQKYGGISRYFINLVKNLDKNCYQPKIIAPIFINKYLSEIDYKYKTNLLRIKSHPKFTRKISNYINDTFFYLSSYFGKPKIIHSTYYSKIHNPKNCKIVITVYDLIHEIFNEQFKFKTTKNSKQECLNQADKIICISENTRKDLLDYYKVDKKKIVVIPLGYPEHKDCENIDESVFLKPYILYVGDRNNYKNFKNFIKSYCNSNTLYKNFNIVCFGGNKLSTDEKNFFATEKIDLKKIKFLDGNDKKLNLLYKKASLYVCPSLYEGFGLTILEAMNMNCPIIASETSSLKEIGKNKIEYFDPKSIDDMQNKIENLIFNEEKKIKMINEYQEHLKNFTWKKTAYLTKKIYDEL